MASKWAEICAGLPELPQDSEESADQQRANLAKDAMRNGKILEVQEVKKYELKDVNVASLSSVVEAWHKIRDHKDELEAALSMTNLYVKALSQMIEAGLKAEKQSSIRLLSGKGVRSQPEPVGKIEDHEKFIQWVLDNGYINKMMMHHGTLTSIVKEHLEQNLELPEGVKAYFRPKLVKQ